MERVKDFLYDISDLFFSLLIIGIIFFVVSWKLTDTMDVTWFSNINNEPVTELDFAEVTTPDDNPFVEPVEPIVEPEEEVDTNPIVEVPVTEAKEVKFTIASGNTGYQIGVNLVSAGLVDDVDAFLQKLGEMNLGNKLQADTFTLNTNMTLEKIILTLARQN